MVVAYALSLLAAPVGMRFLVTRLWKFFWS
jgi:hypothetical protein